ncbi:MAG: polyphosphate kinase 1 [Nitrosomonas sp.]|nr:polyphosphate kinase 1 [Nitrosomonas sp.]
MADNKPNTISVGMSAVFTDKQFLNRELSQVEFNRRVLAQAEDSNVPLLERLRFICIVSSNFDEFFEVRVAGLKEQIKLDTPGFGSDGLPPRQAFELASARAREVATHQYQILNKRILPELAGHGIHFLRRDTWNESQCEWIRQFFRRELMPMLTPIGLDPSHPFPRILNKSLNFAVTLEGKDAFGRNSGTAIVQAPRILPRVVRLPKEIGRDGYSFVFLSSIIHAHVNMLFSGMQVVSCDQFRVTRNSNLFVDEEEIKNLRIALQGELPQRHLGDAVRLEVADNCPPAMTEFLLNQFLLKKEDLHQVNGPVNLVRLTQIFDIIDRPDLKFSRFIPGVPFSTQKKKDNDFFQMVRKNDILLHHPFQSFQPVIEFIKQASTDPDVVAIKQTVYRTGSDSTLMEALISGARAGKEVTVVVELLARFDEEANINWAGRLEEAGAHVVYGIVGYKTHCKMAMVIRRESGQLRRYAHLGTGNYHPGTARLYTDFGLLTSHEEICSDINEVFLQLTGLGKASTLKHLWQSPFSLHHQMMNHINQEAEHARNGKPAAIIAKMNALLEPAIIQALYAASSAGVKINLIVRGACALRPNVPGLSDNIRVRSIIGRFLEHSRIFYFLNINQHHVYLASADWMDRNFFRRVEVCFPVMDLRLKKRVITEGLKPYLRDNAQAWEMNSDGYYKRKNVRRTRQFSAQDALLEKLAAVKQEPVK